jgi:hypothetical protein
VEEVKDSSESFMLSGQRHYFLMSQELYRIRLMLSCKCYRIFHDVGMNDVHCILEKKNSCKEYFQKKIELERLTNSEPGMKLSIFTKPTSSFLWYAMTIGEMSSQ